MADRSISGKITLALEDGTVMAGRSAGVPGTVMGEFVFNTAMSGYQEILTDPSYKGQIVTMTCSHIGNYGVTEEDVESRLAAKHNRSLLTENGPALVVFNPDLAQPASATR